VAAVAAAAGIDPSEMAGHPQAEQVRAPIASFEDDQIINPEYESRRVQAAIQADKAAMHKRMSFDRDEDVAGAGAGDSAAAASDAPARLPSSEAINQLFAPPSYNETGTFYDTISKAVVEKKWVLVNIQQAEVFASHTLNRDVWRDETIQDTVEGSFLFWQRDDKSTEGQQFCQYYQCGHQLPHICVVDPRTKRRVKCWDGRKWVESHAAAEYLFGFLDQFSMDVHACRGSPEVSEDLQAIVPRDICDRAQAQAGGAKPAYKVPDIQGPSHTEAFYATTAGGYSGAWNDATAAAIAGQLGDCPTISEVLAMRGQRLKPIKPLVNTGISVLAKQVDEAREARLAEKVLSADVIPKKFPAQASEFNYPKSAKRGADNPLYQTASQAIGKDRRPWTTRSPTATSRAGTTSPRDLSTCGPGEHEPEHQQQPLEGAQGL
ncbi:unnamed protein product, partial [Prorocentrum cordatum]